MCHEPVQPKIERHSNLLTMDLNTSIQAHSQTHRIVGPYDNVNVQVICGHMTT